MQFLFCAVGGILLTYIISQIVDPSPFWTKCNCAGCITRKANGGGRRCRDCHRPAHGGHNDLY